MEAFDLEGEGERVLELIARYHREIESRPVLSRATPGQVASQLPSEPPEEGAGSAGEGWDAILADVERIILPGLTHWQHPSFFAYFPANASGPAMLGELLAAGLGVQGMLWLTSPACTELEVVVMDWLAKLLGLPEMFRSGGAGSGAGSGSGMGGGVIHGTASEAVLTAMVAARHRARQRMRAGEARGEAAPPGSFTVYASDQTHSSFVKAAMIAGLAEDPEDRRRVRLISTDAQGGIKPDELEAALRADVAAGLTPAFVCATLGTTATGAMDDVASVARACDGGAGAGGRPWLHVDGAYAGAAAVCPEFRPMLAGVERADSFCFNPHKWLLTNFDCDAFFVADRRALIDAMSVTPEYLRNAASESGAVVDYRDWQVPLGRRFRSLKLWFVIRHYGAAGLRAFIREHVRLAELVAGLVREDGRFELTAEPSLSLVCFRVRGAGDAGNLELMRRLNASGELFLTHAALPPASPFRGQERGGGSITLRLAIGATSTREEHVRRAWASIQREAARLVAGT
ncbi:MAG: pyridoxal-dependent decarboxylase [Planctomycetota bacterium]|nr:pyridoxal-dependent decarboxylase [Planctomycetota bacterium]